MAKRKKISGFTLVELLVVIGIIALLISILLPSLNKARASAQSVACAANMRSLSQQVAIYQTENKGSFPPISQWHNSNYGTTNGYKGFNLYGLLKLKGGSKIAQCPTVAADFEGPSIAAVDTSTRVAYSYKYNRFIAGIETNTIYDVPHPVQMTGQPAGSVTPVPYKRVPNSTEVLVFMDYPQMAVTQINDAPGTDRGMWIASVGAEQWGTTYPDGRHSQQIKSIAPVHGQLRKTTGPNTSFSNGLPALMGNINVAYADGSVRTATIKQGEVDAVVTQNAIADTSNATTNGVGRVGGRGRIEGTRVLPYQAP
jgi:prepilin-type N-terminal cleavage/methylation domain-containing protein/prepilin-type processing-associated H-X9-DG protein